VIADSRTHRGRSLERSERADIGLIIRRFDWVLFAATAGVLAYGLWAIAGITGYDIPGDPRYFLERQFVFAGIGIVGFAVASLIDTDRYRRGHRAIYTGLVLAMAVVLVAGAVSRGARSWLDIGPFRFQPSEFGKLLLVLAVAGLVADRARQGERRTVLVALGAGAIPILLVFAQPDLGTALVLLAALAAVLFCSGIRWSTVTLLAAAAGLATLMVLWLLPAAGVEVMQEYQRDRLTAFLHPDRDPAGTTYNLTQSITAVGAGGLSGRGVDGATQTTLNYLPEHATDFAFAALAEQRGFVGAAPLLLLYLVIVWRGLKLMLSARDAYAMIVAGGIVGALVFQIFVNVGMNIGIAPITGVPLPFVSVGGSALIANLLAMGVLQSIHARGRTGRGRRPLR
jgi:rod shape determining protein RodA